MLGINSKIYIHIYIYIYAYIYIYVYTHTYIFIFIYLLFIYILYISYILVGKVVNMILGIIRGMWIKTNKGIKGDEMSVYVFMRGTVVDKLVREGSY